MFFNGNLEFWEVCPKWTEQEVIEKAEEYGIDLPFNSFENRWCVFGQVLARANGLDGITASSMGYVVSMFCAGMGVSAGTDVFFDEEKIDYAVLDFMNSLKDCSEVDRMQKLINFILELYRDNIEKYEYRTVRWDFRLTQSELQRVEKIDGKTRADKFRTLLFFYENNH